MPHINNTYLPHYTVKEWELWEGKWELIAGIPYAMSPTPGRMHQRVSARITTEFQLKMSHCNNCEVYPPIDWKIDEDTVLEPDVSVICKPWEGHYLTFPPEVVFEILSPSTALKDRNLKYQIYQQQGVPYYVIVDVQKQVAEVYQLTEGIYHKQGEYTLEKYTFHTSGACTIDFDFSRIW
jgi:Uma2 family endonuclease